MHRKVRIIRTDFSMTSCAYANIVQVHTIYEFDIDVEPGFKLTKEPQNIIYLPINRRLFTDDIKLRVLNEKRNWWILKVNR